MGETERVKILLILVVINKSLVRAIEDAKGVRGWQADIRLRAS